MRYLTRHHKTLISAVLLQLAILIFLICEDRLMYGTNDDTTMVAIAAGGYGGTPSAYIVNIHIMMGYILKTLYTYLPAVNWMTVTYLTMYALAFFVIDDILADQCKNNSDAVITVCVTGISFYLMISFFSFTVVAYALMTAGVMCLWDRGMSPFTVTCFILAALMRCDVLNTAIAVLTVYEIIYIIRIREDSGRIKKDACSIAVIAVIKWLSAATNTLLLSRDATEQSFYEWGELRSRALDCVQVPYDEELFNAHGFSKAAYDACYGAFYYIHDAVNTVKLHQLIDWNNNRYHLHIIGYIKAHFGAYAVPGYRGIWQGLFIAVIILKLIRCDRSGRIRAIALYAGVIAADYAYYVIQRPLLHVMMPTYVMGSLIGLLAYINSVAEQYENNNKGKQVVSTAFIGVLTMGFIIAIHLNPAKYSMVMTEDGRNSLREARLYIEDHQDKLYFALDPEVFALSVDEKMWKNRYRDNRYNLAGNWEIYSVPSNEMLEDYGIDSENPAKVAPNSDKIVFLHSYPKGFDMENNYVIDLYREYYNEKVHFEAVDHLLNGWGAYSLVR